MQKYIAILRGINVSGHKLIKMKLLEEMFLQLGFRQVKTYIQSGNVVFEAESEPALTLEKRISKGILGTFGFEVPVLVIAGEEMTRVSQSNPFILQRQEDVSRLHVTFLSGEPETALMQAIGSSEYLPDEYIISGRQIFLFCPEGYGNTKLNNNFFEKKLKVTATTRNWKTVLELVLMSETK